MALPPSPTLAGVQPLVDRLTQLPKSSTSANGYSLIPVHAWTHTVADIMQ